MYKKRKLSIRQLDTICSMNSGDIFDTVDGNKHTFIEQKSRNLICLKEDKECKVPLYLFSSIVVKHERDKEPTKKSVVIPDETVRKLKIIYYKRLEGYTYQDISDILKISKARVGQLYYKYIKTNRIVFD